MNYVWKFIPDLATTTEPLRNLTKKDVAFIWNVEQESAFTKLKKHFSSTLILGYHNVKDRIQLNADASPVGLGSVLVQFNGSEPRIISYASKSLSNTEKKILSNGKRSFSIGLGSRAFSFLFVWPKFRIDH